MIIFPHLLSRPQTAMSISLPATEKFTFRRTRIKQLMIITVRYLYHTVHLVIKPISVIAELCCLLHYPARHGRRSGCPFSLRRMTVYQRFDHVKKTSRWIFVQAPDEFSDELRSSFSSGEQEKMHPCNVHQRLFSIAEQEWRDYIYQCKKIHFFSRPSICTRIGNLSTGPIEHDRALSRSA